MARNLDAEWLSEHPPKNTDALTFTYMGVDLVRQQELPLEAFRRIEVASATDVTPLIDAIRDALNPISWDAYDALMEGQKVTAPRLMQLWQFLVSEGTERPTLLRSDSSDGSSENGTTSTGTPPSDEAWTSGASVPGASPTTPTRSGSPTG